ncbi:chemotaxis protein CheD [Thetidibacter halocola]|uniref:Probable chemoreceptor glutamine deamidase CheD n=1 Tax=Thetidibacter halocola TaxID=2827239 RepID=A0A8J7WGM3_9RHOB|nr:chemotaxis protein CheD [Thetidibacter halocola]MBS0124961.1 chemotaxis protein CheD [Thetidibacter halocola]
MIAEHERLTNVIQGDFVISEDPAEVLTTVLGSCVAVCLYDADRGVGGMNHFLLPSGDNTGGVNVRYGTHAMELLINGLLKRGANRDRLQAKVFGGARMNDNLRDIGQSNAQFARSFLSDEGVPIAAESLGGHAARRLRFWATTGRVRQLVVENAELPSVAIVPQAPKPQKDAITLF